MRVTGIAGVNSNYEPVVKFLGHAATSGEQDPSVTHGHRPAADATGGGGGMKKQIKNGHKSALTLTLWAQDGRGQNT